MPVTEQEKMNSADIVNAFSIAITEMVRALKHQQGIPPTQFIHLFNHAAGQLPTDSSGEAMRTILTNLSKNLEGHLPFPVRNS